MTSKQSTHIPELDCSTSKLKGYIESAAQIGDFSEKLSVISAKFLGLPYKANTLVGSASTPEQFTASLGCFDCVTYVETVAAIALSETCEDFYENLRKIRYKHGDISWESRNHYMTDWLDNNQKAGFCLKADTNCKNVEITRTLSILADYPAKKKSLLFIPVEEVLNGNVNFSDGELICFGTARNDLDVSHCGLLFNSEAGPKLRHASRSKKEVIEEPLAEFTARFGESPGVLLSSFKA